MSVKGSAAAKSHGKRYSPKEKANALAIYRDHGPSVAARKTGIPYHTVKRWAQDAGVVRDDITPHEQTARAHAVATTRTAGAWADFREEEALAAGAAAEAVRLRLLELIPGDDSQMLRAVTDAYDKLISNAERLSGQATERIQLWAQTDLDRELRDLIDQLEENVRNKPPASQETIAAIAAELDTGEGEIIDVAEIITVTDDES